VPAYTCYRPLHCFVWVLPGDTWTTISLREYGNPNFCHFLASYNGLSLTAPLFIGQQIRLPEIHPNGVLTKSYAPMPAPFIPPVQPLVAGGSPIVSQNLVNAPTNVAPIGPVAPMSAAAPVVNGSAPTIPTANIREASAAPAMPTVAIGSTLLVDGQALGSETGIVRLRLSGVALKVEVLEWTAASAKIRLPEMDLTSAMSAEIEVLRADGSLAAKTAIQLTPAATKLAQGN
jgi:hypothetical protein